MEMLWKVTDEDVAKVHQVIEHYKDNAFVKNRIRKNIEGPRPTFSRESFFRQMVGCLLTSQQKSGPKSAVSKFIHQEPFPLGYSVCASCDSLVTMAKKLLTEHGGIRRHERISEEVAENLTRLDGGLWFKVELAWGQLCHADDPDLERKIARMLDESLIGFGPKQSRNLLQGLGLTKYEIPLDSRVGKRLREFGFPLEISGKGLLVPEVYEFVLDGVRELCKRSGVYPCVLDAAFFASFDGDGWEEKEIIW